MMRRLVFALILPTVVWVACVTAVRADTLRILSPHPGLLRDEFTVGFLASLARDGIGDVELDWLDQGGTSNIMRFIVSEFIRSPDGINIDLFFGGGTDSYLKLKRSRLLEQYVVPEEILGRVGTHVAGVPVYDPEHEWYGVALAGFGIMYNRLLQRRFKLPEVRTWEDLCDPALMSRIACADPRNSGSAHMVYEIILQAYGWDHGWRILTAMGGNVKGFVPGAGDIPREVALGNVVYGPAIDFYAYAQMVQSGADKLTYVTPMGLSVINADPIGILKGAPQLELAQRFVDYCLTPSAQKRLMLPPSDPEGPTSQAIVRSSVLPSLYEELGERSLILQDPFKLESAIQYDPAVGSRRWDIVNALYGSLIIDSQKELASAWRTVAKSGDGAARTALSEMPVSEAEVHELGDRWNEADYALERKQLVSEWRSFARSKYKALTR